MNLFEESRENYTKYRVSNNLVSRMLAVLCYVGIKMVNLLSRSPWSLQSHSMWSYATIWICFLNARRGQWTHNAGNITPRPRQKFVVYSISFGAEITKRYVSWNEMNALHDVDVGHTREQLHTLSINIHCLTLMIPRNETCSFKAYLQIICNTSVIDS